MKYKLTDETMEYYGRTLHRIQALKDFSDVKAGDLGGWIESERNLSHDGNCWIDHQAKVFGNAKVSHNALVSDNAQIFDEAKIFDEAEVFGEAKVSGNAEVYYDALVYGNTEIKDGFIG